MNEETPDADDKDELGNSFEDEDVWGSDETDQDPSTSKQDEVTPSTTSTDTGTTPTNRSHKKNTSEPTEKNGTQSGSKTYRKDELPHKITRDGVKDGRDSLTIFLSEDDMGIINRLRYVADDNFDENIQTIDVYLAAMRCGIAGSKDEVKQRFIREMESIGYGF